MKLICNHLDSLSTYLELHSTTYGKVLISGNFNVGIEEQCMKAFCDNYSQKAHMLQNVIKKNSKQFQPKNSEIPINSFRECLLEKISKEVFVNNDDRLQRFYDNLQVLNQHAPQKIMHIRSNHMPFNIK